MKTDERSSEITAAIQQQMQQLARNKTNRHSIKREREGHERDLRLLSGFKLVAAAPGRTKTAEKAESF